MSLSTAPSIPATGPRSSASRACWRRRVGGLKLGLEYFCAHGPEGIGAVRAAGRPLFLDLKLHDIPDTVAGAVRGAVALEPRYVTLHSAGGLAMMQAAQAAAEAEAARLGCAPPDLLGVTVLTSLDDGGGAPRRGTRCCASPPWRARPAWRG